MMTLIHWTCPWCAILQTTHYDSGIPLYRFPSCQSCGQEVSWSELLAQDELKMLNQPGAPDIYSPRGERFDPVRFAACTQPGMRVKLIADHWWQDVADQEGLLISNQVDEATPPINFVVDFFNGQDELLRADELLYWVNDEWLTFEQIMNGETGS